MNREGAQGEGYGAASSRPVEVDEGMPAAPFLIDRRDRRAYIAHITQEHLLNALFPFLPSGEEGQGEEEQESVGNWG
jgi:hypothetical protein